MATNIKRGPSNESIQVAVMGSIWGVGDKMVGTVIDCHDIALFGYSKPHPPISYTQAAVVRERS